MRKEKNYSMETSQNWNTQTTNHWNKKKEDEKLQKPSIDPKRSYPSIHEEVDVRRKDGLRKKRRQLWLEREKKRSGHKTANQCIMASHQVLLPSILVLCNRKWACVVSAICDEWQRDTNVDGKAMQPTKSATNHLQPQHTHHGSCTTHHTSIHTMVHTHGLVVVETGWPHSDDQHTMVSWQPLTSPTLLWCSTLSSNTSLLPSSW